MTGFVMKDKVIFQKTGLLPDNLPRFLHGFSRNDELWLYEQPSAYYRRHLLLHEGTHGFMNTLLGGCGPPWYMEGMAELLATHRLRDGRLTLNWMPGRREDVPEWGRIRIVKDACAAHRPMSLDDVVNYSSTAYLRTEPYAWCWALAAMLDRDPRCRDRFRQLFRVIPDGDVSEEFRRLFQPDWREVNERWQVFIAGLEYNDDLSRTALDLRRAAAPHRGRGGEGRRRPRLAKQRPASRCGRRLSPDCFGTLSSGQDDANLVERAGRRLDSLLSRPSTGCALGSRSPRRARRQCPVGS